MRALVNGLNFIHVHNFVSMKKIYVIVITIVNLLITANHSVYAQWAGTIDNPKKPTLPPKPSTPGSSSGYTGYPVVQGDGGESKMAEQYREAAQKYREAAQNTKCAENQIYYSAQATYYSCLADQLRIGSTAKCPKPTQQLANCADDDPKKSSASSQSLETNSGQVEQQIRARATNSNDAINRTLYDQQLQLGSLLKDPVQQRDYYNAINKQQAETQAMNQGVEAVGNLLISLFDAKKERKVQEKAQAERKAAYEERMAEKREEARLAEEERLEEERRRLTLLRQKREYILSPAKEKQLPSAHTDSRTQLLYYLPYAVLEETHIWLAAEPFAITRYADGSWPLLRDIETQIHQTLQKDYDLTEVPIILSGFYTQLKEAELARTEITIRSLTQTGFFVHPFSFGFPVAKATNNTPTDFWGEKKAPPTKPKSVEKSKPKPSFWNN